MYTRTVYVASPGRLTVVAEYATSRRKAKRLGWKPGVVHYLQVGQTRYVFSDGYSAGRPCARARCI